MKKPVSHKIAAILITVLIVAALAAAGIFLVPKIFRKESKKTFSAEEVFENEQEIANGIAVSCAKYLDENGEMEPDEEILMSAAQDVLLYALKLEDEGEIKGCAYCEDGFSVSFFLKDGTTLLYAPQVRDTYSGGDDLKVIYVKELDYWDQYLAAVYAENPVNKIKSKIDGASGLEYGNDTTVAKLIEIFGSLKENNIRAVFWRGHGNIVTADNGEKSSFLALKETVTLEKERQYSEDRTASEEGALKAIVTGGNGELHYGLSSKFFDKYLSYVDGGLFMTCACYSLCDDYRLAGSFINKGFDAFVGTTDETDVKYANIIYSEIVEYLCKKDTDGRYYDIDNAVFKAKNGSIRRLALKVRTKGVIDLVSNSRTKPFRLIDTEEAGHTMYLEITSSDGTVDQSRVSVKCFQTDKNGKETLYNRFSGENGIWAIEDVNDGDSFRLDISYDSYLLKTASFENIDVSKELHGKVDLSVAELDVIIQDTDGAFITGASPVIYGIYGKSGTNGLKQTASQTVREGGQKVYRIPVEPGQYHIDIAVNGYKTKIDETVTVKESTTLTYVLEKEGRKNNTESRPESDAENSGGEQAPENNSREDTENNSKPDAENSSGSEQEDGDGAENGSGSTYADVVRQYEEKYGKLEIHTPTAPGLSSDYYTGVFLVKPEDFDLDGTDELIIGYGVEEIENGISWPYLDVWGMKNGSAVSLFEGAHVSHSDVGSHCMYKYLNGSYCLITGYDGSGIDLDFWYLGNGTFEKAANLAMDDNDYTWSRNGEKISEEDGWAFYNSIRENAYIYYGAIIYETADQIRTELEAGKTELGLR